MWKFVKSENVLITYIATIDAFTQISKSQNLKISKSFPRAAKISDSG